MSILYFATGISQVQIGESTRSGSTSYTNYCEESIYINRGDTTPIVGDLSNVTLPSEFWMSFNIYAAVAAWYSREVVTLCERDTTFGARGSYFLSFKSNSSGGYDLYMWDGSSDVLVGNIPTGDKEDDIRVDIRFLSDSTSGQVDIYLDRSLYASYTGDTTVFDYSSVNTIEFYQPGQHSYLSGFFLADQDSTQITMVQHEITGQGGDDDFTGDYSYMDNLGSTGDNKSLDAPSGGGESTYTVEDRSGDLDSSEVIAVGISARGKIDTNGNDTMKLFVRDPSSIYSDVEGSSYTLTTQITPHQSIFETSPAGGTFVFSTISGWEFGVSLTGS